MFKRKRIIVAGSGRVAAAIAEGLNIAGLAVDRAEDLAGSERGIGSAQTLIVADGLPDPLSFIDGLRVLCRARRCHRPPLRTIVVHIGGAAAPFPATSGDDALRVEPFDLERQAARVLLAERALHADIDPPFGQTVHVLVTGTEIPARALALQALRLGHYGPRDTVLTFACADPTTERDAWLAAYPQAERFSELRFSNLDDPDLSGKPPVSVAFVCIEPPERGLELALGLANRLAQEQRVSPVIHLEIGEVRPHADIGAWDGQILPFSWLRAACRPEVLLDARGDELPRVIHDHYRDSIAAQGRDPGGESAGQPWETLDDSYREASRQQADHVWAKLSAVDCRAVPEERVESFAFAPLEVEHLAVIEHKRWAADRYLAGWTYATVRDNARKHHPQLIPYAELSGPMKDLDRFAVRLVPTLLARSGRGVIRMLLVGLPEAGRLATDGSLQQLADEALTRIVLRYPDRSLVLASTLADAACRLVVRRALEAFQASLFVLCPQPLPETLSGQPDEGSRRDFLELLARAERRIPLQGADELARWFAIRAEIVMTLGAEGTAFDKRKQVAIDPACGQLEWTFEY